MEEQVFLEEGYVTVTRSRIVIANRTYPVANITAIRTDIDLPSRTGPIVAGIIGVILLVAGINGSIVAFLLGVAFIVVAVVVWRQAKPKYKIVFGTAGGEQSVSESEDGEHVFRVADAIDEALIAGR